MDDDEETIFGELEDAAGLAWDGLGAVASAGVHVASGAASVVEAAGDNPQRRATS